MDRTEADPLVKRAEELFNTSLADATLVKAVARGRRVKLQLRFPDRALLTLEWMEPRLDA